MKSLDEYVNIIVDSLKKEYLKDTSALWAYPCLALVRKDGELKVVDGRYSDQQILEWAATNLDIKRAKYIIIGRMVVKYSNIVNPSTGQRNIIEKAIMITGKNIENNRTKLIIIPCKEHKDYRPIEEIAKTAKEFDPSVKNADISIEKKTEDGQYSHYLTARFATPVIYDSNKGDKFISDPILSAISSTVPNIDDSNAIDISDPKNKI